MDERPKSKGEAALEQIMDELDPSSDRYQVLATAKSFKSSWVALGEKLLEVKRSGRFSEWGYENFEDYCSREVRIKKPTAQKLTLAYRYMEKEEPELMARQKELSPLPDFRSVELLRQAREEKNFSEEEYADLRKAVVEENRSHPTIAKRFKEVAQARDGSQDDPLLRLKACLGAARRLASSLDSVPEAPPAFMQGSAELITWLEEQLALLSEGAKEAAE